jgi:hypothetical protein
MGSGCRALIAVEQFTNVVAAGLRPVDLAAAFHTTEDGPQGRGYSSNSFFSLYFFGDGGAAGLGAFAEPAGAGVAAGFASSSSTSKIRVELAARSGLTALSP